MGKELTLFPSTTLLNKEPIGLKRTNDQFLLESKTTATSCPVKRENTDSNTLVVLYGRKKELVLEKLIFTTVIRGRNRSDIFITKEKTGQEKIQYQVEKFFTTSISCVKTVKNLVII